MKTFKKINSKTLRFTKYQEDGSKQQKCTSQWKCFDCKLLDYHFYFEIDSFFVSPRGI